MEKSDAGTVRLTAGEPWSLELTTAEGVQQYTVSTAGTGTPPTWTEVDAALWHVGYELQRPGYGSPPIHLEPGPCPLEDGMRIPVVGTWERREAERVAKDFARTGDSLLVTLPSHADAAALATEVRGAEPGRRHGVKDAALLRGLVDRLDDVRPAAILVPAEWADSLTRRLRHLEGPAAPPPPVPFPPPGRQTGIRRLADLIDQGRRVSTAHPFLLDALRNAFAVALSLPGSEGVAARDELVRDLERFVALHRDAVHPDDEAQLRIQAERGAAEQSRQPPVLNCPVTPPQPGGEAVPPPDDTGRRT